MTTYESLLSFGHYLKAVRLEKGISLEDVSKETKIRTDNLLLIEKEECDKLPAEIFIKGFLRAYAKAIGADGDEAVRRYMSSLRAFQGSADLHIDLPGSGRAFWFRLGLSLGALMCIIALSVFAISILQHHPSADDQINKQMVAENNIGENNHEIASKPPQNQDFVPDLAKEHSEKSEEKLLLKIMAVEDTWIKIITDDLSPKQYNLKPGDQLDLEASSDFNLLIGNAAGVNLTLNDKIVEVPGKSGEVVNVRIP